MSDIVVAKDWSEVNKEIANPVRNTKHKYIKFLNSDVFNEEARNFLKNGYYTNAPYGTKDYNDYWDEQEKRCLDGYTVGGVRITGRHYFMLNFGMMKARKIDPITGEEENTKKITFPRFLDHQYYLFHVLEECFAEGDFIGNDLQGICILKGRRKGISYLNAMGVYDYNYTFIESSNNVLCAYEKAHYRVTLDAIWMTINNLDKHTAFTRRRDKINQREHFKSSYIHRNKFNQEIEDGYMSEVRMMSFKDNPFKGIGDSTTVCGWEEGGRFKNLLASYTFQEPTWRDGDINTGVSITWGTGGNVEEGSQDLYQLFYNAKVYGLKAFDNIYDDNATGETGFFIDTMWYYPGKVRSSTGQTIYLVDKQGNSNREEVSKLLDEKRKVKKKGTANSYLNYITQEPKTPSEAFMRSGGNKFDAVNAELRLQEIEANKKTYLDSIHIVSLSLSEDNKISFTHKDDIFPIREYPLKPDADTNGAIEIYEMPVFKEDGTLPYGLYIAGCDTVSSDKVKYSDSLGSLLIMNIVTERIVAEYTARPKTTYEYFENCRKLLMFYNALCNYENNIKGMCQYFERMNSVYLLADTPQYLRDQHITNVDTTGNNRKGTPSSGGVNAFAHDLINNYTQSQAYDKPDGVMNMYTVRSLGLLKELIAWSEDRNCDRVSALGMLLILKEGMTRHRKSLLEDDNEDDELANDSFFKKNNIRANRNSFMKF